MAPVRARIPIADRRGAAVRGTPCVDGGQRHPTAQGRVDPRAQRVRGARPCLRRRRPSERRCSDGPDRDQPHPRLSRVLREDRRLICGRCRRRGIVARRLPRRRAEDCCEPRRQGRQRRDDMGVNPGLAPADVVRGQYLASAAGDLDALRATLAPDVEWTEMAGFPLAGTYRTPDGVTTNVMEKLAAEWDDWTAHDDIYVVDGENVVVLARYTATQRHTGKP